MIWLKVVITIGVGAAEHPSRGFMLFSMEGTRSVYSVGSGLKTIPVGTVT